MAEINLFNRRWHISSDAIPLFSFIIGLFYFAWLIAFIFGTYVLENTGLKYDCQEGYLLRLANYSLVAIFFVSGAVEMTIVGIGLQGGPLEPGKRRGMTPFLYLKVVLYVLLVLFTALGTFVVASPIVAETCWQQNPCVTSKGFIITGDCKMENGSSKHLLHVTIARLNVRPLQYLAYEYVLMHGVPVLTPPCKEVFREVDDFTDCWVDWIVYAFSWNETGRNWTQPGDCQVSPDIEIMDTDEGPEIYVNSSDSDTAGDSAQGNDFSDEDPVPSNFTSEFQLQILSELGVPWEPGNISASAPWWFCFTPNCKRLLSASDHCSQWDVVVNISIPDTTSQKYFLEAMIYSSWGMLLLLVLMGYALFNSFPDYSTLEGWEGTLKGMANTCCSGKHLEAPTESGSEPVSKEIARCLFMLFGGIDLDPSDRLLGMYLVAEQQKRRRQGHVLQALQAAGIVKRAGKAGVMARAWRRIAGRVTSSQGGPKPHGRSINSSLPPISPSATRTGNMHKSSVASEGPAHGRLASPFAYTHAKGASSGAEQLAQLSLGGSLPSSPSVSSPFPLPSPFEDQSSSTALHYAAAAGSLSAAGASSLPIPPAVSRQSIASDASHDLRGRFAGIGSVGTGSGVIPMYRHTMVRLRTGMLDAPEDDRLEVAKDDERASATAFVDDKSATEGASPGSYLPVQAQAQLEPPLVQAASRGVELHPASCQGGHSLGALSSGAAQQEGARLRVVQQYHPMLTPSGCVKALPITPQQAATIYSGYHDPVPQPVLTEAQRMSKFAIGAYGLQSVIWGKGRQPAMCMGNINMLVKCLGKPLRIESKFRKRNFNAILKVTETKPADLLYVSYANASGGALPYMIMLQRETKSVVLSVRGTVSMEDMVTDLISTPVPVDDWMPDWVNQVNTSGEKLYAHTGMVSAATAILKDLEEKGLLNELLLSQLSRSGSIITTLPSRLGSVVACYGKGAPKMTTKLSTKLNGWHQAQHLEQGSKVLTVQPSEGLDQETAMGEAEGSSDNGDEDAAPDLSHLSAGSEVKLPLKRAQSVIRSKLQTEGWQVVVTGHSLGAAVACLISFHLKDAFPDLHCWAFNPPGGLVSWNLSQIAQRLCTSIVVGKDVISRLTFSTSKRLVNEMVLSLARCKRPKLKVLGDMMLRRGTKAFADTLCSVEEMSKEAVEILERYHKTSMLHTAGQVEMYPPGRLVFLRPFKGRSPQQTVWDAVWVEAPALIGEGILVSASMRSHHRLFVMSDALRSAVDNEARHAQQGVAEEDRMRLVE